MFYIGTTYMSDIWKNTLLVGRFRSKDLPQDRFLASKTMERSRKMRPQVANKTSSFLRTAMTPLLFMVRAKIYLFVNLNIE